VRTLAFVDLAAGIWGAAWLASDDRGGFVCLGDPQGVAVPASGRLEGASGGDEWRVLADGVELTLTPAGDVVDVSAADGAPAGFEQLCRAQGRLALDGDEHTVDCLARRAERADGAETKGIESVRDVCALFEPADGLAVVSLRPRRSRGHEDDVVTAAVLDPEGNAPVADPRFSTTYGATGRPIRSSFELWLGQAEDEFPRRAAGEAVGPHADGRDGDFDVQASLFRWHSRGREGAGVYILARPA
jgi:hypothetical protein